MYKDSPFCEIDEIGGSQWLVEVDKCKITSIEALLEIIESLKGRNVEDGYIQTKLIAENGVVSKFGLKLNSRFWPPWILEFKRNEWVCWELK